MTGWWFLLILFGGLAVACGIDVFTGLIWGTIGINNTFSARITKNEPRLYRRLFITSLVIFIASTIFFLIVLLAVLNPAEG
jgi:hypothetical protein